MSKYWGEGETKKSYFESLMNVWVEYQQLNCAVSLLLPSVKIDNKFCATLST